MAKNKGGRPALYTSVKEVQKIIDQYFAECKVESRPLTITGLAYALQMTTQSLVNYGNKEKFFSTIQRAKLKCERYAAEALYRGKGQVNGVIFNLKNNHGWKDTMHNENNNTHKFDEAAKKLRDLID